MERMEETVSIEVLRYRFREAKWHRLGDQVMAYMRLVRHPEACWGDLLDALDLPGLISDDAATVLQQRLLQSATGSPARNREFWEQLLAERGLALDSPCTGYQPTVEPPSHLPSLVATELDVAGVADLPTMDVMSVPAEASPDARTV